MKVRLRYSRSLASPENQIFGLFNILLLLQIVTEERGHLALLKERRWLTFYQGNAHPYQELYEEHFDTGPGYESLPAITAAF